MAVVGDIGLDLTPEGRAAMERLNELADVTIEVGYQADQKAADDETSLAEVAYWNHYGTLHKDGSVMIPARPFMDTIKKHSEELSEFSQQALSSLETADEVANLLPGLRYGYSCWMGVCNASEERFWPACCGSYRQHCLLYVFWASVQNQRGRRAEAETGRSDWC